MRYYWLILLIFFASYQNARAQNCNLTVEGVIIDEITQKPLDYASIYIEETNGGTLTDSIGFFQIRNLCRGNYHFKISHIGCEPVIIAITLSSDTIIEIVLKHNAILEEIEVKSEDHTEEHWEFTSKLDLKKLNRESGKVLGEILNSIVGVNSLNNGSGISKPIIHGLYGNRIKILNNEIPQAGQQWGNDHAPEIDPNNATDLSVLKGVNTLMYGGNSIGGLVLVEPGKITNSSKLQSKFKYGFESNGLANNLAIQLEQSNKKIAWRWNASSNISGDKKTSRYFLNNTGNKTYSTSFQLSKIFKDKWSINGFYSFYLTELGILRGAHIGNLTDLEIAIERDEPFFTEEKFSYKINSPRQTVQHHLAKLKTSYFHDKHSLKLTFATQINQRKEFDVRRNGRSDIPALSLLLVSNYIDVAYQYKREKFTIKTGLQATFEDNSNNPETGILPLIPDYDQAKTGLYLIFERYFNRGWFEIGTRYDYRHTKAYTITTTLPRDIEILKENYHDYAFIGSLSFEPNYIYSTQLTLGIIKRSPAINELYSFGLHQGVSGIEKGNTELKPEQAFKILWMQQINFKQKYFLEVSPYVQLINEYIYLEPQDELELTIRGAFPVFEYKSTNAILAGIDVSTNIEIVPNLNWNIQYEMVRGIDVVNNWPLVYIPADNINSEIKYQFKPLNKLEGLYLGINGKYVFEQKKFEETLDFLIPPKGYFVMGLNIGSEVILEKIDLNWFFSAENLLNTTYRDYLNRLRYYADEEGVNLRVGLGIKF